MNLNKYHNDFALCKKDCVNEQLSVCPASSFVLFCPHFLVFHHFYHGPTLATTNSTLVLEQIKDILEQMKNQTGHHNETLSPTGHSEGHASVFLPEALVMTTRERPVLCLLLMLGTLWLGYALYLIKRRYVYLLHHLLQ